MDNKEQATKWFENLIQGCYLKTSREYYPRMIFWVYDKNLIRQKKLNKITGIEKYNLNMSDGKIIMIQDVTNKKFRIEYSTNKHTMDCSFMEHNFNISYKQVKEITKDILNNKLNSEEYKKIVPTLEIKNVLNKEYTTLSDVLGMYNKLNKILDYKEYIII